jgi:hypothetical protein
LHHVPPTQHVGAAGDLTSDFLETLGEKAYA